MRPNNNNNNINSDDSDDVIVTPESLIRKYWDHLLAYFITLPWRRT